MESQKMPVRSLLLMTLALAATPALALEPQDTLREWSTASGADRDRLLQQLEAGEGSASRKAVLTCLNDAAGLEAHAALKIKEVFAACAKQASGDPV